MTAVKESHDMSAFASLSPGDQFLLYLISVVFEPVSATFLHAGLGKVKSLLPDGSRMKMEDLQERLVKLRAQGFLNEKNY